MRYFDIRERAKKKVQLKVAFYICTIVFTFTSILLLMLSHYLPSIAFWLRLPIPIFVMVLSILYFIAFGLPFQESFTDNWQEDEIEREMVKIYRREVMTTSPLEELSDAEILELKELERLNEKWESDEENYI